MSPDKVAKLSAALRDCLDGVVRLCSHCDQPTKATHYEVHDNGIAWLCSHHFHLDDTAPIALEPEDDFENSDTIPCPPPEPERWGVYHDDLLICSYQNSADAHAKASRLSLSLGSLCVKKVTDQ